MANVYNFNQIIEIEKIPKEIIQQKKSIFAKWFTFQQPKANAKENIRYMTFVESRLVVLREIPEKIRNYGSHFQEDSDLA